MKLKILLLLLLFIFLNVNISQAWTENFNGDLSYWIIKSGGWSIASEGSNYFLTVDNSGIAKINRSIDINTTLLTFDFMWVSGTGANFWADINSNATIDCTRACAGSLGINTAGNVFVKTGSTTILSMSTVVPAGVWRKYKIIYTSNQINIQILYLNNTLIESKYAAYYRNYDNIWLVMSKDVNNYIYKIDNISTTTYSPPPTPTPTPTYNNTYIPSPNFTLIGIDFSSCGWGDVICGLGVLYNSFWNIIYTIFDYLYYLLYSVFAIPIGIITSILNGLYLIFSDISGLIGDLWNLGLNIKNFIQTTLGILYLNSWITLMTTGITLVILFRIYGLIRGGKT